MRQGRDITKTGEAILALQFELSDYMLQIRGGILPKDKQVDTIEHLLAMLVNWVERDQETIEFKNFSDFIFKYRPDILPTIMQEAGFQGHEKATLHKMFTLLGVMDLMAFATEANKDIEELEREGYTFDN